MLTTSEFISKYEVYSDVELYEVYLSIGEYSEEAKEALAIVIKNRGGIDKIKATVQKKQSILHEENRIGSEVDRLGKEGVDIEFLKKLITSDILSVDDTHKIIETRFTQLQKHKEDIEIKPRTIMGSILGGGIASIVGGILHGIFMIQTHRIMIILVIGQVILSYSLIRLCTKQSKNNSGVFIATILSVMLAFAISQIIFQMFAQVEG